MSSARSHDVSNVLQAWCQPPPPHSLIRVAPAIASGNLTWKSSTYLVEHCRTQHRNHFSLSYHLTQIWSLHNCRRRSMINCVIQQQFACHIWNYFCWVAIQSGRRSQNQNSRLHTYPLGENFETVGEKILWSFVGLLLPSHRSIFSFYKYEAMGLNQASLSIEAHSNFTLKSYVFCFLNFSHVFCMWHR